MRSSHRTAPTPSTLSSESTQPCSSPRISAERKILVDASCGPHRCHSWPLGQKHLSLLELVELSAVLCRYAVRREPEVRFGEIIHDSREARFWIASGLPTMHSECAGVHF